MKRLITSIILGLCFMLMGIGLTACGESNPVGAYVVDYVSVAGSTATYKVDDTIPDNVSQLLSNGAVVSENSAGVLILDNGMFSVSTSLGGYKGMKGTWENVDGKIEFTVELFSLEFDSEGRLIIYDARDNGSVTYVMKKT